MKMFVCRTQLSLASLLLSIAFCSLFISCKGKNAGVSRDWKSGLKRGEIISCGPPGAEFGNADLAISCSPDLQKDFNLAVSMLHSFEYDEAEKLFTKIIDKDPNCAMPYWGIAMCNYHQLWPTQPSEAELEKGAMAIATAQALQQKTKKESAYIEAIAAFYKDWKQADHRTRVTRLGKAMEKLHNDFPDDREAAIFYALALNGAANPADKSYSDQKKAAIILDSLYRIVPNHPGIVHYIIHTYDYPELAELALPAARKYAAIAPSSAHAQHMPSHIFTRLGLWDECIQSNLLSTASAKCYGESMGIQGHWDEELHGMDYLVYAYLQKGDNKMAKEQWDYLNSINQVNPVSFKTAYAFAAIPSRYVLENKHWQQAATLSFHPVDYPWQKFPWQAAILHFARAMGNINTGSIDSANSEIRKLNACYDSLVKQKNTYQANQVKIQITTAEAWLLFRQNKKEEALKTMKLAADMEDKTEKSPVTPGEVIPASELLGDMFLEMDQPVKALNAYEADLKKHANRFNGLYGAAVAAKRSGNLQKATEYYYKLVAITNANSPARPELESARSFLRATK